MHIERLSVPTKETNVFLAAHHAEIHQSAAWAALQSAQHSQSWQLIARSSAGDIIGFAQIFQKVLPFGMTWLHVPRGPVGALPDMLLDEIEKIGKECEAVFVRFDWGAHAKFIGEHSKFIPAHATHFPETTLTLDLMQSEEQLLAQMKPKGRYNIRLAEKHGVTVRESTTAEAADIFFDLLEKTIARDGFAGHAHGYYRDFLHMLSKSNQASCFIAEQSGQPVAASFVTYFADRATYYYGASDHASRQMMAPYLVQWMAIKAAKERGLKIYDFLGIAPADAKDHQLAGVTNFKKKFGGMIMSYPKSSEFVLRPFIYVLLKIYKKLRWLT